MVPHPYSDTHLNKQLTPPRYQARLAARPLFTQAVTTSILFGLGDTIAQQAVEKKGASHHDLARTGRMCLYGGGTSPLPLPPFQVNPP